MQKKDEIVLIFSFKYFPWKSSIQELVPIWRCPNNDIMLFDFRHGSCFQLQYHYTWNWDSIRLHAVWIVTRVNTKCKQKTVWLMTSQSKLPSFTLQHISICHVTYSIYMRRCQTSFGSSVFEHNFFFVDR